VRDKRKEGVRAVERALEGVEHIVGEAVKERRLLVAPTSPTTEEVDIASAGEQVEALVVARCRR